MHFQSKVIKFVLSYIPIFYAIILKILKTKKELTSVEKCNLKTCVTFKNLATEIIIACHCNTWTKNDISFIYKRFFQFQVGYVTSLFIGGHHTLWEQGIKQMAK